MSAAVEIDYPSTHGAECPYSVYEFWRGEAPVYNIPDRPHIWVVSRYEDVKYVAQHPEVFSSAGSRRRLNGFDFVGDADGAGQTMLESDPPVHSAKRALVFPSIKPGRLRAHEPWIAEIVDRLIDGIADRGECDFVADFSEPLPVEVMMRLFAIPARDRPLLDEWSDLEFSGIPWVSAGERERQLRNANRLGEYLTELALERRESPGDDLVSEVIRAQVERDGDFDLVETRAQLSVVLAGGAATTQHMLGGALLLLLEHPEELERCRRDAARIPRVLEEAMRLESSVQWVPRAVERDTEIAGTSIPAGSYVLLMFGSANRDPAAFDDPARFDPDRPHVQRHLAFGSGPHSCVGAPLARLEGRIAFERLLARLRDLRLVDPGDTPHVPSPSFRGLRRLRIAFEAVPAAG
jgi:cytochrome P450